MKSIWAVLLDTSKSMAGGFEGQQPEKGNVEYVRESRKILAAKNQLIAELDGLRDTEILLITFDTGARIIERSHSSDVEAMKARVRTLAAEGSSTNIAAALSLAADAIVSSSAPFKTALLISDGLSNVGDPIAEANRCRSIGIQVNTILIDPTVESAALADEISKGGRVWTVRSERQMARAAREATAISKPRSNISTVIPLIASVIAVCGTLVAVLSAGIDKPGLLAWVAAAALLCFCPLLMYVVLAKDVGSPIYTSETEFYEPKYFKHSQLVRMGAIGGIVACLLLSGVLFSVGSQMRQTLDIRIANDTDFTFSVTISFLPKEDRVYFLMLKPHEVTEYHRVSKEFLTTSDLPFADRKGFYAVRLSVGRAESPDQQELSEAIPRFGKITCLLRCCATSVSDGSSRLTLQINRD